MTHPTIPGAVNDGVRPLPTAPQRVVGDSAPAIEPFRLQVARPRLAEPWPTGDDGLDLGDRLREVRKARGMSLYDVQERTGRHLSTIAKYERGERRPSVEMLRELAEVYDVTVSDLVDERPARAGGVPAERTDLRILMAIAQRMRPEEVADLTEFLKVFLNRAARP